MCKCRRGFLRLCRCVCCRSPDHPHNHTRGCCCIGWLCSCCSAHTACRSDTVALSNRKLHAHERATHKQVGNQKRKRKETHSKEQTRATTVKNNRKNKNGKKESKEQTARTYERNNAVIQSCCTPTPQDNQCERGTCSRSHEALLSNTTAQSRNPPKLPCRTRSSCPLPRCCICRTNIGKWNRTTVRSRIALNNNKTTESAK